MNKKMKWIILKQKGVRLFWTAAEAVFFLFMIFQILKEPSIPGKIVYLLMILVIGYGVLTSHRIRAAYQKMVQAQTWECDPKKASQYREKLEKMDRTGGYRETLLIFETLQALDDGDPKKALKVLDENEKVFRHSLDQLLVRNFTRFYAANLSGDEEGVKAAYKPLRELEGKKVKGQKISPLYSWQLIDAIYLTACHKYKQALECFKNTDHSLMNPREETMYWFEYGKAALRQNRTGLYADCRKKARECGSALYYSRAME